MDRQFYYFKDLKVGDKVIYCHSSHYNFGAKELVVQWVGKDTFKVNVGSGNDATTQNLLLFKLRDGHKYGASKHYISSRSWCERWTEKAWAERSEQNAANKLEQETKRARNEFISLVNKNINGLSKVQIDEMSAIINAATKEASDGQS